MRKPWLLNLLLIAALAVAVLRLSRFLQEPLPPLPEPPPAAEAPAASAAPAEGGGGADPAVPGEPDGEDVGFDVIVARDLFSPTRGVVPPKPVAADTRPAAKPLPQPKLTLFGVVIVEGDRAAYLLEGTGDAKPRRMREGESIAGATVKAIRPDGVTLTWAGGEMTVALRTPKDGAAAAPGGQQGGMPGQARQAPGAQPAVFPRRFPQTGGTAPGVVQPGVPVPGVPRLLPTPDDEEEFEDDEDLAEDDEDLLEDDAGDEGDEEAEEE